MGKLSSPEQQDPLIDKLVGLGIHQICVQIKAVDGRHGTVLTEYFDPDTTTVHWIWFPVSYLTHIERPVAPKSIGFLPETLSKAFDASMHQSTVAYARQTLIQFFEALHQKEAAGGLGKEYTLFDMPSKDLHLHDIICWGVWNKFGDSPITGWMSEIRPAMHIQKEQEQSVSEEETTRQINTTGDEQPEKKVQKQLAKILDDGIDALAIEELRK